MGMNLEKDDPTILANFGIGLLDMAKQTITAARYKTLFTQKTIAEAMKHQKTEKQGFEPGE